MRMRCDSYSRYETYHPVPFRPYRAHSANSSIIRAVSHGDELPQQGPVEFIGPFRHHEVVVNGWKVPYLSATPGNGGIVHITLDHRFDLDLTVEEADRVLPFLADCIAVASGYSCHPKPECQDPPLRRPFGRMIPLNGLPG